MKSTRTDVQSFAVAFAVIDREMAKLVAAIAVPRPGKDSSPPKRPHRRSTTHRRAA